MTETTAPLVLCVCPAAPSNEADSDLKELVRDAEQSLNSKAGAIPNVHTIGSEALLQLYQVTDYYDSHSRHLGHIPFTPACYAAIGTALSRTIFNLNRPLYKVIVLDCDDTLWNGVCAEVGPIGVDVGPAHRSLQEFMVDQMNAGKLLCLCSKNNEKDVMAVFDQRSDMILKREHLVSWRINWKSKSENIRSLADELNLGLDSFIFIDDNPVDCADVRINLPGVLSLRIPRQSSSISSFLKHVWAFDCTGPTEADRARTRAYHENAQREQFHQQTLSLKDFIDGLQLHVEIREAVDDQLARVSQLTFRTNQFNFTTIRRHENEIRDFMRRADAKCLAVRVVDRFGDYGLVGVVMYEAKASTYEVDTFLLSCRVLGRGLEHAVLSNLGKRALMDNKEFIELTCLPTDRNSPAMAFIQSVADQFRNENDTHWTIPATYLANLEYQPDELAQNGNGRQVAANEDGFRPQRTSESNVVEHSERLQDIAENLCNIDQISKAIEENRLKKLPDSFDEDCPMAITPLQTSVLNIWRRALGTSRIGINDNFFEAGGTSLKAVQVIAMLKKELNRNLSIVSLFEYPTVALLAAKLTANGESSRGENISEAVLRGRNRRTKVLRRAAH
jgi:FkbH-like protein